MGLAGQTVHSLVDFPLEYPHVEGLFFLLLGCLHECRNEGPRWVVEKRALLVGLAPLGILALVAGLLTEVSWRRMTSFLSCPRLDQISCLEGIEPERAMPPLQSLVHLNPWNAEVRLVYAYALWKQERAGGLDRPSDRTLGPIREAIRLDPRSWLLHYALGQMQSLQGNTEGALEELKVTNVLYPLLTPPYAMRADLLVGAGRVEEALRVFQELFAQEPVIVRYRFRTELNHYLLFVEYHGMAGELYAALGDVPRSAREYRKAVDLYEGSMDPEKVNFREAYERALSAMRSP